MSITKKKISKDISSKIDITERESLDILEAFISNIKTMSQKKLMISNFGVFHVKTTKKELEEIRKQKKNMIFFRQENFLLPHQIMLKNTLTKVYAQKY